MTCPSYRKTGDKHNCYPYGNQDESKAIEDCMGDFTSCFQNAREKASSELSSQKTNSPYEPIPESRIPIERILIVERKLNRG